jgi:hypothetical protein
MKSVKRILPCLASGYYDYACLRLLVVRISISLLVRMDVFVGHGLMHIT